MQTHPQIDFHQMESSAALTARIEQHIGSLEKRFGRITACRIVVTGPGGRHKNGGLYEVHIDLTLPRGLRVAVNRLNQGDERRADVNFAVDNAFKRARRQLLDRARRLQGSVKHHEEESKIGTVIRLDPSGEYGFIASSSGDEVYFHRNSLPNGAFRHLRPGARVKFLEETGEKGLQARAVSVENAGGNGP